VGLGAAVACADRKTVVVEGDGSGRIRPRRSGPSRRERADVTVVVMKNEGYGILNIELARVGEGDPNKKKLSMLRIDHSSLDWVKLAEGQGVPATRATTAEEFHKQFDAAMSTKGPRLIEAHIAQDLKPVIDAVHDSMG
jgi:acetolactate synthase-1/2/3 large subunit